MTPVEGLAEEPGGGAQSRPPRWTRERFVEALTADLDLEIAEWQDEVRLAEDLGWDSLVLVEVAEWAAAHGVDLPDELLGSLRTMADLWGWVGSRLDADEPSGGAAHGPVDATTADPIAVRAPSVTLIPIGPRHEDLLVSWLVAREHLASFRLRGATPTPERLRAILWEGVLAQFVAVDREAKPVAWVSAFQPDFRNRHVHVAAVTDPAWIGTGLGNQAVFLLLDHVFAEFDFRKVYAEVLERNFAAFASGAGRWFEIEGRLTEHEFVDGSYEDLLILAVHREAWLARRARSAGPTATR